MTAKLFLILGSIASLAGCSLSHREIEGTYYNENLKDSLFVKPNNKYEYVETLINGKKGWTKGAWSQSGKEIHFVCDLKPLVGVVSRFEIDSAVKHSEVKLLLLPSMKTVNVEKIIVYKNKKRIANDSNKFYSFDKNIIRIYSVDFDSLMILTKYFKPIVVPNNLKKSIGYSISITPLERVYTLDKCAFKMRRRKLISIDSSNKDRFEKLVFEKINS